MLDLAREDLLLVPPFAAKDPLMPLGLAVGSCPGSNGGGGVGDGTYSSSENNQESASSESGVKATVRRGRPRCFEAIVKFLHDGFSWTKSPESREGFTEAWFQNTGTGWNAGFAVAMVGLRGGITDV